MTNDTVIKVENLSKHYTIAHENIAYGKDAQTSFKKNIMCAGEYLFNRLKNTTNNKKIGGSSEIFHALKDINFEIKKGERVGIIGRNGAGKSTILKILSRITRPTTGEVRICGRVSSLLEVGTGFHPELTGRENIFLNGSILGMSTDEIKRKFDEIVEFAGIEKFLDTPVKRYSSGMYVRLAFSVAAHLDTDILIIDEVLAVGDAAFQKKCLGKISQISGEGRTVIFVSHQMRVIRSLCPRVLLLENGTLTLDSNTSTVIEYYQNKGLESVSSKAWNLPNGPGDRVVKLLGVSIRNNKNELSDIFDVQDTIILEMQYIVLNNHKYQLTPNFRIFDSNDDLLFFTSDVSDGSVKYDKQVGAIYISKCLIPGNFLTFLYFKVYIF